MAAAWVFVLLALAVPDILYALVAGTRVEWSAVRLDVFYGLLWAALTPGVFALCRRFPLDRGRRGLAVCVHVGASLVLLLLDRSLLIAVDAQLGWIMWATPDLGFGDKLLRLSLAGLPLLMITYWLLAGVGHAIQYDRLRRARELQASRLEASLARARLRGLKMQLQPHFLFGTLQAISRLVDDNPRAADRMIARLSDLLRMTLENEGREEVSLKEELEFLDSYLRIEQARLGGEPAVRQEIEPETLDARVPHQVLQPLVEDVLRPGAGAAVVIRARRRNGTLEIEVWRTATSADVAEPGRAGVTAAGPGLANVRARMRQLYGDAQRVEPWNGDGEASVTLALPFHVEDSRGEEANPPVGSADQNDGGGDPNEGRG